MRADCQHQISQLRKCFFALAGSSNPWGGRSVSHKTYCFSIRRGAHVDDTLLLQPYPQSQRGIECGVENHSGGCVILRALETELVIPKEAGGSDEKGGIAQA